MRHTHIRIHTCICTMLLNSFIIITERTLSKETTSVAYRKYCMAYNAHIYNKLRHINVDTDSPRINDIRALRLLCQMITKSVKFQNIFSCLYREREMGCVYAVYGVCNVYIYTKYYNKCMPERDILLYI